MSKHIKLVQNQAELVAFKASNDFITPNVTLVYDNYTIDYNSIPISHDYSQDYLTFVAQESGTFKFSENSVNYSVDNGETWTTLSSNTDSPTVSFGDKIMWKAELTPDFGIGTFSSTGSFTAQGNPMSLLYGDNFKGQKDLTGKDYAFTSLFYLCAGLTNAENISLPATTLSNRCYLSMFCGCTSLTTTPELPATSLTISCYNSMFSNCTSLTIAPELPATTLAKNCYYEMFRDCRNLTTAPVLPATTLVESCYASMFRGCMHLNSITCLATDISATDCTNIWVHETSSNGTFTKAASMTGWTTGSNGIPSGWTVQDAS